LSRSILVVTVTYRYCTGFPAASLRTAGQGTDIVNELMMRIGFPMRRFTTTRNHYAGAKNVPRVFRFDRCGQMHQAGDAAECALRVVNQADQLADRGFSA
jgi:hypothetical protein